MVCVQIQIVFTQRNHYHAQIFVYVKRLLHKHYMHIHNGLAQIWAANFFFPQKKSDLVSH